MSVEITYNNERILVATAEEVREILNKKQGKSFIAFLAEFNRSGTLHDALKSAGMENIPSQYLYFTDDRIYFWGCRVTLRSVDYCCYGPMATCLMETFPTNTTLENIYRTLQKSIPNLRYEHISVRPTVTEQIVATVYYVKE